jgi:cupin 2 domain-containing protein
MSPSAPSVQNLLTPLGRNVSEEITEQLLQGSEFQLQRIVSTGQATPAEQWYDQETEEWVVLLQGQAEILFAGSPHPVLLQVGDFLNIPAHCRHRVQWTDRDRETVWLVLHYKTEKV